MWILSARAVEPDLIEMGEVVQLGIDGMLAGEQDARRQAAFAERRGDGCKIDCLGTSSDDEIDPLAVQPSPYLGGEMMAPNAPPCKLALADGAV